MERSEKIEQTTAQLLEAQNQVHSEQMAVTGEVSPGVAHDLRNHLSTLRNGIYFLRMRLAKSDTLSTEPRVAETLELMDESITQCDGIIVENLVSQD